MEKKQSSIDWLIEKLMKGEFINNTDELIEQAKAMHKEEILETWYESILLRYDISGNQYYKKTFRGQDNE